MVGDPAVGVRRVRLAAVAERAQPVGLFAEAGRLRHIAAPSFREGTAEEMDCHRLHTRTRMDLPVGPDRATDRSPALDAAPPEPASHAERLAAAVGADPIARAQANALREAYGAANVPAVLEAVHAGGPDAVADLTAHPERYGAFVETPKARQMLSMLAGTLPNMDPYGGINAVLNSIPRPTETQDADPASADAAVRPPEAGPDMETRTLRPPGVYITGPDAEATYTSLNAYSYLDLRFDRTTGQLTSDPLTPERLAALPPRDQQLLRAITNTRADVVLTTTREGGPADRYGQPGDMVVGMYDGNTLDPATGRYETRQLFNLRHANIVAGVTLEHAGSSVMHEINEAFLGTDMSISRGNDTSMFSPVHAITESQDEHKLTWGMEYNLPSNRFPSDQILIGVDHNDATQKSGRNFEPLYVDSTRHIRLDKSGNMVRDSSGGLIVLDGPPRSLSLPPSPR